jgi:hypothetical protein
MLSPSKQSIFKTMPKGESHTIVWLKVVTGCAQAAGRKLARDDYPHGRAVQREKYLRKTRSSKCE